MKFISSLELIESPVEKLALKGLPNEIAALRSNLRTSVTSVGKKMMNDVQDAEGERQFNGQIKHPPGVSNQVKNVLPFNSCDLTVKKVIIPAEWEKKLAESSSKDGNGLSESDRISPGFISNKANNVHKENSGVPKQGGSVEIESLKSKNLNSRTSIPERSAIETSNGQLHNVTNGIDEWSNEASKSASEESLSSNHSSHTFATNVTNDLSAKMPQQTESCSPKSIEFDVGMDENSTFLGIHVKDVKKCDSEENELNDESESTGNLNSGFEKDQLDRTFENKINSVKHPDEVSELDTAESSQENMLVNKSKVTADTRVNPYVENTKQSEDSPKFDSKFVEKNELEEKTEIFNFCDKLAANTMDNNTHQIQASNDFSSISSDDGNSKLANIVDDLENMDSLQAPNAESDNSCNAVDQSSYLDELNSEYEVEEPDNDMSGLNDFNSDHGSEIDIHDNVEDLENVEGNDKIDVAMDVEEEIENGNVDLDKIDELGDANLDEPMDIEKSADKTDKVVNVEAVVIDSEEVLDKTGELDGSERDVVKICEPLNESTSEPLNAEEMLGDLEESKRIIDETCEKPPDTSSESANAEESSEISKPQETKTVVSETCVPLNEASLGMAAESGECESSVSKTNGETGESSKAEETLDEDNELSKEVGLIKAGAEATLNMDSEFDEVALNKTSELEAKDTLGATEELVDKSAELTSAMFNKVDENASDGEALDRTIKVVDEALLGKTIKLGNVEAVLAKPVEAEAMSDKPDESSLNKTEATLDKSDEVTLGKLDESMETEETSDESLKLTEGEVGESTEKSNKEGNVSKTKIAKTTKENEESSESASKVEVVSEESVDTKEKVVDVDSKALLDSAASDKCLERKPGNNADVPADTPGAKRLASENEVIVEVKRTKVDKEDTFVTEDSNNSDAGKEANGEVIRTASKRLSEPIEVSETKKPRLQLSSEIGDNNADVGSVHDSDKPLQPESKDNVEPESESKEIVSAGDKVTDSSKKEEASSHVDSKAAPADKDASQSTEKASNNSAKTDTSKADVASPPKPVTPKQITNVDLAIERVVAASAAATEAAEAAEAKATAGAKEVAGAAETTAIDIDDDDDEVVATVPAKPSEPKKLYSLPFMDKLHSNIVKKMGRNELEEFVMQKVCEVITERSQLGRLRQQVQALEEQNESWRKKTQMLQKQLKDLDLVMKRFVNDSRMKRDRPFPVKVTRSVGLQVHMPGNGPLQPGKQRPAADANRNQPVQRRRNRVLQNASQSTQNAQQSQPATTTAATSSPTVSTTTVQQLQPQPQSQPQPQAQSQLPQIQASPIQQQQQQQQQQPILAQMVTTSPNPMVKAVQQNAKAPVCNTVTVQKVVPPNLAKMGTTATLVNSRTSTSNLSNTAVKLPAATKPVPIRPAITTVSTLNTITTVNSTAGSLSTGLRVASASQLNSRTIRPGVTATLCPVSKASSDSKVIDLTDEDEKSKLSVVRFTTSSTPAAVNNSVVTTATTSVHSGAIRVVHPHQLTGNPTTTILTAGNQQSQSRFAYLMPSSASPGQQRQVLIATSAAQVRPGMVTVSNRPTMPPATFLLKNGSMLPLQQPAQAQTVTNAAAILRPATSIQQSGALQTVRAGQPVRVSPSLVGRIPSTNMPTLAPNRHPAPLPVQPMCQPTNPLWKCSPPKPDLRASKVNNNKQQGIVLSWNLELTHEYEEIASYQLFAYQEGPAPPNTSLWKKVGDVKALPLPMACTLTQFMEGHKYHFAVRAVDVHSRVGPFSAPRNVVLTRK